MTATSPLKIFIATPCYAGVCHAGYTLSLAKTIAYFMRVRDVEIVHKFILHESLVPMARNSFAAHALSDPSVTHLLFIDSDIKWEPEDIVKLLKEDKPLIAATFPKKRYIWNRLRHETVREIIEDEDLSAEDFEHKVKSHLVDYAINLSDVREAKNGVVEVKNLATGFMLIKREVLEKMMKAYPEKKIKSVPKNMSPALKENLYGFFELTMKEGEYLSEDYQFCKNWASLGGKMYADLSINLEHHGAEIYEGSILETFHYKHERMR
jgi:hypothetical protein